MLRGLMPIAFVLLLTPPARVNGQRPDPLPLAYEDALATYRGGSVLGALGLLSTMSDARLVEAVELVWTGAGLPPQRRMQRIRTAVAMQTELVFQQTRPGRIFSQTPALTVTRSLVRRLARAANERLDGAGAERRFARNWYLIVASFWHGRGEVGWSRAYLDEAQDLFPGDPEVLLVSGTDHEMLSHLSAGYLRQFRTNGETVRESEINPAKELSEAERLLRQAVERAPELAEARLRLGRVLHRRGDLGGAARELRAALEQTGDQPAGYEQVRYLAWMFLGQVEVDRGDLGAARRCYAEALRLFPEGQAALVAQSEASYLEGRGADAASEVVALLRLRRKEDPWWGYLLGDWWHFETRLAMLRAEGMQ
jgi:tetratricopeptide (TPR) repeat protein